MKYKSMFFLFAAACLTACNSNDLPLVAESFAEDSASYEPRVSNVPIRFAPVDLQNVMGANYQADLSRRSSGTGSYSYDRVGIFCLAKYSIEGLTAVHTPTWSGKSKDQLLNSYSVWKKNELGSLSFKNNETNGNIVWNCNMKDETAFYPDNNWFAYGFALYYPYTKNIYYTQKTITAFVKVDGDDDVCYAVTKSPKVVTGDGQLDRKGFSKSYYEGLNHDSGVDEWIYPVFQFNRLVSRVDFYVRLKEQSQHNVHVEKIELEEFPCIMKVALVNRATNDLKTSVSNVATRLYIRNQHDLDSINDLMRTSYNLDSLQYVEQFPEMQKVFGHFELREENGETISEQKNDDGSYKYNLTTSFQKIGGGIMVPPVTNKDSRSSLKIYVTLCDDEGNRYRNEKALVVPAPSGGYKVGYAHTVPIALDYFLQPAVDGEIEDWQPVPFGNIDATDTKWEEIP